MKFLTILFSLIFSVSLSAQNDIFELLAEINKKQEVPTGIQKVAETTYSIFTLDEEAKPTKTIEYEGTEVNLYGGNTTEIIYESTDKYSEITYNEAGEKSVTSIYELDDQSRITSWITDYGESPAAAMMNTKKEYFYNEEGKVVSIFNQGAEVLLIKYNEKGNFNEFLVDMGFAKMKIAASPQKKMIRYDMAIDVGTLPEGLPEMMLEGIKDSPKAYIEQTSEKESNSYVGYEENKETGEFEKRWETVRSMDFRLLSKKEFSPDGEVTTHQKFQYTETGKLKSTKDLIAATELINEYDEKGNITVEQEPFGEKRYFYDKKGGLIKTISLSEGSVTGVSMREIVYK